MKHISKKIMNSGPLGLSVLLAGVLALSPSSAATASQVWLSGSNTPAGYLVNPGNYAWGLAHMLDDAVSSDIWATTPGGYCNAYKTGSEVRHQNSHDVSDATGFNPGAPYYDWQVGDAGSNNVCQARGSQWGFRVSGVSNNNCSPKVVCGMHHFHRFGGDVRPWNGSSPGTALTFNYRAAPKTVNLTADGGATGYFCALLREVNTPHHLEICVSQWTSGAGFPDPNEPLVCADTTPAGYNVDTVWTDLDPVRYTWMTQRAGSANTFRTVPVGPEGVYQGASISAQDLKNIIARVNQPAPHPNGCSRGLSSDVRNYQLIGFENGVEGGGFSLIGASVFDERIATTSDALFTEDRMYADQYLKSASDTHTLYMQGDGKLIIKNTQTGAVSWNSGTLYPSGAYLRMQEDGNLVIYRPNGTPLGSTRTDGHFGAHVVLQEDGKLVVYHGNQAKWSSADHPSGFFLN